MDAKKTKRLDYNDFAKVFGMLLIIWGHIKLTGLSNEFVYAFHIPLFFFLSGMVFNKSKYASIQIFFWKKVKSLLYPYVVFSVLTWLVWAIYSYFRHVDVDSYFMPLAETFIARGSGGFLVHNVPLWFVTCLFVMEIGYYFISRCKQWMIIFISAFCALISYMLVNYCSLFDFTLMPWNIEVAMLGLIFYAVGNLVIEKWSHEGIIKIVINNKTVSLLLSLFFGFITIIGGHFNGSASMGHSYLGRNPLVFYVSAFAGIIMTFIFCILLSESVINKNNGISIRWLKWFGQNSFTAMAIHNCIKGFVVVIGLAFKIQNDFVSFDLFFFLSLLLIVIITCLAIVVINLSKKKVGNISVNSICNQ